MRLHKCGWVSIQSGERLNGIQEVSGSIPLISTKNLRNLRISKVFSLLLASKSSEFSVCFQGGHF